MTTIIPKTTVLAAALLAALVLAVPAFAQDREAMVRVAHLSPDTPAVDVYVNDEPVNELADVPFKTISPYLPLPAGTQSIKAYPAGDTSEPIVEASIRLRDGASYTIGVVGLVEDGSLKAQAYEDDNAFPAEGNAKLRTIHAAPDVDSVDIATQDGGELFADLGFPNASRYAEVPAETYTLIATITGSDEEAFLVPDATLSAGTVYTAFAVGQAEEGTLEVILSGDAGASGGKQVVTLAGPMPDSGGVSPVLLLLLGVTLVAAASFSLRMAITRLTADRR